MMRYPVFVSTPNCLSQKQIEVYQFFLNELSRNGLEPHTLGQTLQPTQNPLHEVLVLAKHMCGGVILGFEQFCSTDGVSKPDTEKQVKISNPKYFPSPWNQLEAGILYTLGLPLLILKEPTIDGGIFDHGVTRWYTHTLPFGEPPEAQKQTINSLLGDWKSQVREYFYRIA
jgi:hypothetical protein